MPHRKKSNQEKADEILRLVNFGEYLTDLRVNKGVSLAKLGEALEVSANHLSEIERGRKNASDELLRKIAAYYQIDEASLFLRLNRIPLSALEELEFNNALQITLSEINKDKSISESDKSKLYDELRRAYKEMVKRDRPLSS
jgi:transcriptional regulator with XRE-family HTH domain